MAITKQKLSERTVSASIAGGYIYINIPDITQASGFKTMQVKLEDFLVSGTGVTTRADYASLPPVGVAEVIYITLDDYSMYIYDSGDYQPITSGGSGDMILAAIQSVTGLKTFDKDKIAMKGTSTGTNIISVANTSATDYTNTIPAKSGTFAMLDDIATATELNQGATFTEVGELLNHSFPGVSLDAAVFSGSFPTGCSQNNKLIIASGSNDWARYLQFVKHYIFEKQTIEIYFKCVTKNSGDAWGITQNPSLLSYYNQPIYLKFDQSDGTNSGRISIGNTVAANENGYSQPLVFAAGDSCKLSIIQRPGRTITILENITDSAQLKAYGEFNFNIRSTGGQYRLSFLGGQQEFTNITITSQCRDYGGTDGVVFLGDSITQGSGASTVNYRWTDILMKGQSHLFENIGIGGWLASTFSASRVQEFITDIDAKYLVVNVGYNDHAQSTNTTTYRTNLETIATTAQALGYTVIFVSLFPNYTLDSDSYDTAMATAASNTGCKFIDIRSYLLGSGTTANPNYIYDGVHPNDLGHQTMANAIALFATELTEQLLLDFSNDDVKFKSIPFAKSNIPLLGIDADGRTYKVDPSKYQPQNLPILQTTLYGTQTGNIGFNGKLLIGNTFQQKNATGQGLQIGFNNGINDTTCSNINITNSGTSGIGTTQYFNDITGLRNIIIAAISGKSGGLYDKKVSGNDNLSINSQIAAEITGSTNILLNSSVTNLTSGINNIFIGSKAGKAITTGRDNIIITSDPNPNGNDVNWSAAQAGVIAIGTWTNFGSQIESFVDGEIAICSYGLTAKKFTFGPKGMNVATSITWRAGINKGTDVAAIPLYIQAHRGTGTGATGKIIFQVSNVEASGTTEQNTFKDVFTIANAYTQTLLTTYNYDSSTAGDTVGDTRTSNQSGWYYIETCTVANATKGAGTWVVTKATKSISLTDSNMSEGVGSYVDLLAGKAGFGRIIIGDAQEYADFVFKADGTVILLAQASANVVTTSTDAKLVIRDAGTNVRIVNELGSTLTATIEINYTS